jgi:hypothetical protein
MVVVVVVVVKLIMMTMMMMTMMMMMNPTPHLEADQGADHRAGHSAAQTRPSLSKTRFEKIHPLKRHQPLHTHIMRLGTVSKTYTNRKPCIAVEVVTRLRRR